jgi:hypothetical protein
MSYRHKPVGLISTLTESVLYARMSITYGISVMGDGLCLFYNLYILYIYENNEYLHNLQPESFYVSNHFVNSQSISILPLVYVR